MNYTHENKKKFLEESEDPCNSYKIDWDSEIEGADQNILKFESKYGKKDTLEWLAIDRKRAQ